MSDQPRSKSHPPPRFEKLATFYPRVRFHSSEPPTHETTLTFETPILSVADVLPSTGESPIDDPGSPSTVGSTVRSDDGSVPTSRENSVEHQSNHLEEGEIDQNAGDAVSVLVSYSESRRGTFDFAQDEPNRSSSSVLSSSSEGSPNVGLSNSGDSIPRRLDEAFPNEVIETRTVNTDAITEMDQPLGGGRSGDSEGNGDQGGFIGDGPATHIR
ncbi:hypothetical protein Clacol_001097 [Clathrus columnatus]|uniref:Uncharacterized protein n=1 Tax=Clathrus columnatus TaxID=1419009 RepID=A0AAV4ZXM3_9AGAM|nr:hypothetical protein Clacol_001097 [Clathrus columnatus]